MGGQLPLFVFSFLFSFQSLGALSCSEVAEELKAMRIAQQQLLESLARKNMMMAAVLDQSAERLEKTMSSGRSLRKSDLKALRVSAGAFRGHEQRESALVSRFDKASADLLEQAQSCLNQKVTAKN